MLERVTTIFALASCFFGCTAQAATQSSSVAPQPLLLPEFSILDVPLSEEGRDNTFNLAITKLFLNPQRKLSVTLANLADSRLPLKVGILKIFIDGLSEGNYPLAGLSDQPFLPPKGYLTYTTPLILIGRHEVLAIVEFSDGVRGSDERYSLKRLLEGLPIAPDIVVNDLELTEDLELMIVLSNAGEADLHKGAIFQVQVHVNDQKISEFDHFISEELKANSVSRYVVAPPYQVGIAGISKVKVSISPELSSDDIRLENNTLEKIFVVFPFRIGPRGGEEFTFSVPPSPARGEGYAGKVRIEARWEGRSSSLMLSLKAPERFGGVLNFSGKSPLRAEFPFSFEKLQKESVWSIFVTNPAGKKVEGYLVIQHP